MIKTEYIFGSDFFLFKRDSRISKGSHFKNTYLNIKH